MDQKEVERISRLAERARNETDPLQRARLEARLRASVKKRLDRLKAERMTK